MTQAEWLACDDVERLLKSLRQHDRKARLFSCACCRQIWEYITDPDLRDAVAVSERFADEEATAAQLKTVYRRTRRVCATIRAAEERNGRDGQQGIITEPRARPSYRPETRYAVAAVEYVTFKGIGLVVFAARASRNTVDVAEAPPNDQIGLFRDIFGNPFRPVPFSPSWRTDTAVALARQMYEARDFSAMPILADALQDAGCTSADILYHCRGPGPRVRGCWVVDLVLGRG
jgi:hypothetical protein